MVAIDIFDKRSLTKAVNLVKPIQPFIYTLLFSKNKEFHAAENIDYEVVTSENRLAQFVNANEGARIVGKATKEFKTVKVPRIFEKKIFTADELLRYKVLPTGGVYVTSTADRVKNVNQMILNEVKELKDRVYNRLEQLACEALVNGTIEVEQDNISFNYDFGYTIANKFTVDNDDKWDASSSDPIRLFREWKRKIMRTTGLQANTLIVGTDASEALIQNESVRKQLDTNNFKVGTLELNGQLGQNATYVGRLIGIDIWEYEQTYLDGNVTKNMIGPDRAILVAPNGDFRHHFAPMARINNANSIDLYSQEFLLEPDTDKDKTTLEWKQEHRSMPMIHNANCVISATVL